MAMTPEPLPENRALDFRAPPPSPVAPGRRSSFTNDEVLTEFLQHSLKVPELMLPDRVFPRQKSAHKPPKLDFRALESTENETRVKILEAVAQVGCLEVINHEISRSLIKSVLDSGRGIFGISLEKKRMVARSQERRYGFEEFHGEEEKEMNSEEFVWCGDEAMEVEMEGIWSNGYSNFSGQMDKILPKIEEIAGKVLLFLQQDNMSKPKVQNHGDSICCIQKHNTKSARHEQSQLESSLRYDVIRMLIRGSEFPHALCLHICSGLTDFHVYSKKGWLSFCPDEDAIVVTIGDKLQELTGGLYKPVIGRPVFKNGDDDHLSMAFLYSPRNLSNSTIDDKTLTISLGQQVIVALTLALLYKFILYIYTIL